MAWPVFDGLGVDAYVTTRDGGISTGRFSTLNLGLHVGDEPGRVRTNRARVAAALGTASEAFVWCEQAHRPRVQVVTRSDAGRGAWDGADAIAGTDALVTADPGLVLAVMVADCVPLVLFDPTARVLACVHAGWRGTVLGVTTAAVEAMTGIGADPARIVAGIGPAISPDLYQVGPEVVDAAGATFGVRTDDVVRPDGTGKWLFDLWRANAIQLRAAGVPAEGIQVAARPTGHGTPFFSHRFEGPCGRFAAVARLSPLEPEI
jgi:YfiH family protein